MNEYKIPRLKDAAFVGAVWLVALSILLVLSPTTADSLVSRVLTGSFTFVGAIFLLKISLDISADENIQPALVREPAQRVARSHRAA